MSTGGRFDCYPPGWPPPRYTQADADSIARKFRAQVPDCQVIATLFDAGNKIGLGVIKPDGRRYAIAIGAEQRVGG